MTDPAHLPDVLGFELFEASGEGAAGRFEVADRVRQRLGLVHGGTYAAMAEELASVGTFVAVQEAGNLAIGQSNHTTFMRPVSEGSVDARATPRHSGRTTWVWDVEFTDGRGRTCALSRVTIAVRPAPA